MADEQNNAPAAGEVEIKKVEAQRDEYLNAWKRSAVDFINYKKEEAKRFEELTAYASADFAKDLLPVLDSFDLGMQSVDKESPAYKGMLMIRGQLQDVLRKRGVERIVVARGDAFNPEFHEAMLEEELPPDAPDREKLLGRILAELVPGYTMRGRVVRATKVVLGKMS